MKFLDLLKELAKMLMHHCLSLPFRMRLMLAVTPVDQAITTMHWLKGFTQKSLSLAD